MDRHVEFTTQLAHLVVLHARGKVDSTAEKAALRLASDAAKHGAVDVVIAEGTLRAGSQDAKTDEPELAMLQSLLTTLGVARIRVRHHAKRAETKRLAKLLGAVAAGRQSAAEFARDLAAHEWKDLDIRRVPDATPASDLVLDAAGTTTTSGEATSSAVGSTVSDASRSDAPVVERSAADALVIDLSVTDAPVVETSAADALVVDMSVFGTASEVPAADESATPVPTLTELPTKPLAEQLPAAVETLLGPAHRELFERLITASTPPALRRLLDPVQAAIEQAAREGAITVSVRLVLAMLACEGCAEDDEMRRQFVVTLRRLTKPTLLRAYAMHYADAPECGADVEQALARFGADGAEAVADRAGSAPTRAVRARYAELLSRLPGTNDALIAMLDDQRDSVVERAIELIVALRHPEMERVLGDQLGKESLRVRQAAARGLAAATDSAFAADALVRATQDDAPEVRLTAAVGLQSRREERLVPMIVRRIDEEEELDVQLALVTILGRLVTPEGVQKLIGLANPNERMLRRPNMPLLRLGAIEAIGEARTPAAMGALQKLLEDKEQDVRETAARLYSRARRQTTASAGITAVTNS